MKLKILIIMNANTMTQMMIILKMIIIKEVDEAFVLQHKLYNIKYVFTKLRSKLISIDTFYDLYIQVYYYRKKSQLKM